MWKITVLILMLQLCGGISGNSIYRRNEWSYGQQPVNQQAYYSQYGQALHDLASYQQKVHSQGLNPPFILHNNGNDLAYQYNHQERRPYYHHPNVHHEPTPVKKAKTTTTTTAAPTTKKGNYHKVDIAEVIKHGEKKHDKKPLVDKKLFTTANKTSIDSLNSTIHKISDNIENRVNAIKEYVDQSVQDISKLGDDVYQRVGNKTSKVFEIISEKLEKLEMQLQKLKFGSIKRIDDESDDEFSFALDADDDEAENMPRFLLEEPNVVDSEVGKKFRNIEALDAEMRMDLKNSINDAMGKAQEKFNRLIEEQVSKVNRKINEVNEKFEAVYGKIKSAIGKITEKKAKKKKIYTPPTYKPTTSIPKTTESEKYTTIHWKPKSTTWAPPTPDYYKYTVPPKYQFRKDDGDTADDRMDKKVEDIERIDKVKSLDDGDIEKVVDIIKDTLKYEDNSTETSNILDDLKSNDDSLKSITESAPKSDDNDLQKSTNAAAENQEVDVEKTLVEELRNEMENKLPESVVDEIDNLRADDDDTSGDGDAAEEEEEEEEVESFAGEQEGSYETERDNFDNEEIPIDVPTSVDEEESQLTNAPTQVSNFQFDELEVIQLIPVIIAQLKQGHVTVNEQKSLGKIFGSLWPLITAESERNLNTEEMNPLLKTILNSDEVRFKKRDITAQIDNDIYKNSLRRVYRGNVPKNSPKPYIAIDNDQKQLSPSERLLNMIAAIVHKSNVMERSRLQKRRQLKRKKSNKNPLGIVTGEKPKERYVDRILSVNRMKRSLIKFGSDLDDMKALVEQFNVNTDNDMDDYDYEIDPYMWSPRTQNFYDDYENGSVNEFINLARQRDRREKNFDEELDEYDDYEVYDESS